MSLTSVQEELCAPPSVEQPPPAARGAYTWTKTQMTEAYKTFRAGLRSPGLGCVFAFTWVVAGVVDAVTTHIGLRAGAVESNALPALMMQTFGTTSVLVGSVVFCVFLGALCVSPRHQRVGSVRLALALLGVGKLLVGVSNIWVIHSLTG